MEWLRRECRRLVLLVRRDGAERAMRDEFDYHLTCEIEEHLRRGLTPDEARRRAAIEFGNVEAMKELARDARGTRPAEDLLRDLRYAARVLRANPGYTIASVLTFALGIGAAAAIFSVVYGVLLRPLPYGAPDRLAAVWERNVLTSRDRNVVSIENFEAWRDRAHSFAAMAAVVPTSFTIAGDTPERAVGAEITAGYFRMLGVAPALGRDFDPAEERHGLAIVLSDGLWRRRFGGDPGVVGRSLTISGQRYLVVAVMPPWFDPPRFGWLGEQQAWFPFVGTSQKHAWGRFLLVIGRLRDGVTLAQARAEMIAVAAGRERETPSNRNWSAVVFPLAEQISGEAGPALLALLAAVALLLGMAVTNVAMLTLSSMRRRDHEFAVRRAIGASEGRLFRQVLSQSLLVASMATAIGLLAAPAAVRLLRPILPPDLPRAADIRVDAPVLAVSILAAALAALVFGTVAARRGAQGGGGSPLLHTAGGTRASARASGMALVTAEVALALALAVLATLMIRSLAGLKALDLGFDPGGVAIARVALPGDAYPTPDTWVAFFDRFLDRARAVPGVSAAGVISTRPFGGQGPATSVSDPLSPAPPGSAPIVADVRYVDAAALDALRIPLLAGQAFDGRDRPGGPVRALISADLARLLWPGGAVGHRLSVAMHDGITPEVIGVVGSVHLADARTPTGPVVYLADGRFPSSMRDVVVRADAAAASIVPALRSALAGIDATLPLYAVNTMPRVVDLSLASDRFTTVMLSAFGAVSLLLVAVGVFGVFAEDVSRRRKEIGIRLALGARMSTVVRLIVAGAMRRAAAGVAIGAAAALLFARAMAALLFGVAPFDLPSFAMATASVVAVALVATVIPTVQAIRRSPLSALREG
ncbi:MAG TPA: ADOP family duplicated permease [Vicinamibacterales bacterium]|nr:ADOP family duplicated permease [Vicinamibacterales bacterium]